MQPSIQEGIKRVFSAFDNMGKLPKSIIKHGTQGSLALLTAGALLVIINHATQFNAYTEFIATSIVKSSFVILAEMIIGGLVIDFMFKR